MVRLDAYLVPAPSVPTKNGTIVEKKWMKSKFFMKILSWLFSSVGRALVFRSYPEKLEEYISTFQKIRSILE